MAKKREHSHYEQLKNKWVVRHQELQKNLWNKHKESLDWFNKHTKQFAVGSLSSLMLLSAPAVSVSAPNVFSIEKSLASDVDKNVFLVADLANILPKEVRVLTGEEEQNIGTLLSERFGFRVTAELEGKRLNRSYGLIGAEQHLARFPGDTMGTHFDNPEEAKAYWSSGMAPGLGAWGHFAKSPYEFTEKEKLMEKYYIAVRTFLAPGYMEHVHEYYQFFKFRKMLVLNPQNGRAIVTVIGDAGPADWTGKHLGGSPEVIQYLERVDGALKGPVLYFFIDDPNDHVPLGPITVQ